ncbi:MAG: peptide ABC transporter substrate-binding protein [Chloroflexi bacterium]|nr:peptide ABC transporter substrate-binding protein [Chloroflexota bacterium]
MPKKTVIILVSVVSLCLLVGLCIGTTRLFDSLKRTLSSVITTTTPETNEPTVKAATASPSDTGNAIGSGTLRLVGSLPPTLDPAMVQDSTSAEYVVHLYSGLVTLNNKLEIVPDLAERWELSADGKTYTFTLNSAAVFQDGRQVTSADVVYSLERACSPELASPVAVSYLGDIVGVAEFAAGQAEHISGLTAPDAHTVVITIDAPKAYFLAKLTYPSALVVDREQVEQGQDNWQLQPNGSGPFILEAIDTDHIVLARNERYYGRKPALAKVEFLMGGGDPMTMYENDQLDIVGVSADEIERVLDPANPLNAELYSSPELSVQYLAMDTTKPPFDDRAVRQALAMAIDRDKIAELVLLETASAAKGILPPGMPGFDPALEGLPYDPQRARELLAESRYGAPGALPEIVLAISGTSGYIDGETRAILYMLETNLGITVTVEQVAWEDFLNDMNQQVYQIYNSGWIADYPDPQNFLDLLFHSGSSQNHMGYANPQVDALLEQARIAASSEERYALYQQAEKIIVEDAVWIPLTHGIDYSLAKPYVHGFSAASSIYPWLTDIAIVN